MRNNNTLPSFAQAERFAAMIGVRTEEGWKRYVAGKSREDLFQQVLSVINNRVVQTPLEE